MTINCKGKIIDLSVPKVMGILNVTPDSFYDGGKYASDAEFLGQAERMLSQGATFLDLGAYSSRPGAAFVPEETEKARLLPAIDLLLKEFPELLLSIDTFRSGVARDCVQNGAALVNDISAGLLDADMLKVIAQLQVPYVMMHMRGNPGNMQQFTDYGDLLHDIMAYFSTRIFAARQLGINDLILDPGFGFSKTVVQNYELLHKLDYFRQAGLPVLVGISRKSMIYKVLGTKAEEALNGTTVLNTIALSRGAGILRVHDVKEAMECVRLVAMG